MPHVLCVVGVVGIIFAYWGTKTDHGRHTFDEMAGMIPLGVGLLGVLLVVVGAVWLLVRSRSP